MRTPGLVETRPNSFPLVACDEGHAAGRTRDRVGRDAVLSDGVALVDIDRFELVCGEQLSAVDCDGIQVESLNGGEVLGEALVERDVDRALVLLCEVRGPGAELKAIRGVSRREDQAGELAVAAVQHHVDVALLGLRGQAGAGTAALGIDDDEGDLGGTGLADAFLHEGEARSRGAGHGADTGNGRADGHVHGRQFVLRLPGHAAESRHPTLQGGQQLAGGGDGIAREEASSGGDEAEADRLVPGDLNLIGLGTEVEAGHRGRRLDAHLLGEVEAGLESVEVLAEDGLAQTPELAFERFPYLVILDVEGARGEGDGDAVLVERAAQLPDGDLAEWRLEEAGTRRDKAVGKRLV